ncbi:37315_t:CDS:1 [Gigaspora margarita]|uniref:37315_t:CDS:1 n=1 Tax=Gigaspora margarita TaxID=4874 RepID=A0ABM8VXB6_GIGMA|nr:37315_t:CDS:1 [Gigaspora margarita]
MDFENFTPIENTDLLSNLKISKGFIVFIPNEYSPALVRNNETVNSQNMIKELSGSTGLNIPRFILNTETHNSLTDKPTKKSPNSFILFRNDMCDIVKVKYPQFSNYEASSFIRQLWGESSQQIKNKYRQLAKDIKLEYQKQNSSKKYTYKKQSAVNSYKKKRLDANYENNVELTEKVKQILNFHLNNSISKESNEINNCKEDNSKDSNERNNDQKDYSEETKGVLFDYYQPEFVGYDIFGLNSSQFPIGYNEWPAESTDNPSALQLIDKSEDWNSTENLIDNSVPNGLQTTENLEFSKKVSNLDLAALMRLIT